MGGNPSATDAHIAAIMQHCKRLKAFSATARDLSDATITAVASQLDDVRHLWLYDCAFASDQPILALSKHCRKLTSCALSARDSVASQAALVTLMSNLHSVVELRLQGFELIDPVLEALAVHCPHLEVLNLYDCIGYSEVGIAALARGCTALKKVCAREDDEVLTPGTRLLWQVLRSGLRFSHRNEATSVWTQIYDISREKLVIC
jgi:F-box/leucine-rich repeat protein 2/20